MTIIYIYDAVAHIGYVFKDIKDSLLYTLNNLGQQCQLVNHLDNCSNLYLILGLHVLRREQLPSNFIAYQLEQLPYSQILGSDYFSNLQLAKEIWDYSRVNMAYLQARGFASNKLRYLPPGYSPSLLINNMPITSPPQVVFYGSLNARRQQILDLLKNAQICVHFYHNNCWGEHLKHILRNCRIVLNLHYFPQALLELTRISIPLSNKLVVISERGVETALNEALEEAVVFVDDPLQDQGKQLITQINYYLQNATASQEQGLRAQRIFTQDFALRDYLVNCSGTGDQNK